MLVVGVAAVAWAMHTRQEIALVGWALLVGVPLAAAGALLSMAIEAWRERRWWRRRYRYTVGGVAYHYDGDATFSVDAIAHDQDRFFDRWAAYYRAIGDDVTLQRLQTGETIAGTRCYFRREDRWLTETNGKLRYVAGLCRGDIIEVAVGNATSLSRTAHVHELSHRHLHVVMGYVEEATAHEIFKAVGV